MFRRSSPGVFQGPQRTLWISSFPPPTLGVSYVAPMAERGPTFRSAPPPPPSSLQARRFYWRPHNSCLLLLCYSGHRGRWRRYISFSVAPELSGRGAQERRKKFWLMKILEEIASLYAIYNYTYTQAGTHTYVYIFYVERWPVVTSA